MQLPVWQRREVIEDILDIKVFSTMNTILKEKIAENKEELSAVETEIRIITEQAKAQKSLIDSLQHSKDQNVKVLRDKIETNITEINDKTQLVDLLNKDVEALNTQLHEKAEVDKNIEMCKSNMNKLSQKLTQVDEHIEFFTSNETCPSCEQGIQHEHKDKIISKISSDKKQITDNMDVLNSAYNKLSKDLQDKQDVLNQIQDKNISISTEINAMNMLIKANNALEKEINELSVQGDIDVEKDKIKVLANEALQKNEVKMELVKEKQLQEIAGVLLRDTGIKTTIIREYLPAMNKLINMYLSAMDFFVKFELDESFNETIKSRFRDEFTYASFSEGEKMRIDLAILFTWRQIAKMKNSVNTNLLLLDEIFDSSLDVAGTDYFLSVMDTLGDNTNVFVISHKGDVLLDKFKNNIRFEKTNDFSSLVTNS
jgi:DNA repair exonuclease SbcCD ATPase subunit